MPSFHLEESKLTPLRRDLPNAPGLYYWSEWKSLVTVEMRGKNLFVTPPNGVRVKITHRIAGTFKRQS
jgi:hypothetical protein